MNSYEQNEDRDDLHIAIIGMAGRFPGAKNIEEFWNSIQNGVNAITFFSDQELLEAGLDPALLHNPQYVKARGVLNDVTGFDASFFNCTPIEAEIMDPQHRLFLESAWTSLEDAGYNPETYPGLIGVFAGSSINTYMLNNLIGNDALIKRAGYGQIMVNNDKDHLATRTAYKFNLRGASLSVQTACSTSLVAIHLACQSLLQGECDMVLAGGVSITVPHTAGYIYQDGGTNSPDGYCRAFDKKAQGMVKGNGVGVVVLKRYTEALRDGDHIYAVIRGTAMNNDGSAKVGYAAPGVDGQARAIRHAQLVAEVEPESLSYIETHGTGTLLGDPIEIAALTQAFQDGTDATGFCAIGSVKTNVGHLDAAAGVTGVIKTALMLQHKVLPPSLHYEQPNPQINFAASPFYVQTQRQPWPTTESHPRRAGVSSFGIGGTNAHAILEEAPERVSSPSGLSWQLLTISARSEKALMQSSELLTAYLQAHSELQFADVVYTLQVGRKEFEHRQAILCRNTREAIEAMQTQSKTAIISGIKTGGRTRQIAFAFPGQGAQYIQMARGLYDELPTFRQEVDTCAAILQPLLGIDLRTVLYPNEAETETASERLKQTDLTQPALFVVEYAFAKQWLEWGVQPQAMIGHSIGEYVAACLAGVFSLEDALKLVARRGQLMQQLPKGDMLAITLSEEQLQPYLGQELSLATKNASNRCVVSGTTAAIAQLEQELVTSHVQCRRLHTSHAFHSAMMEPILTAFTEQVKQITINTPKIPYLSNVTGTYITEHDLKDPLYWARHLRQTVRFSEGLETLLSPPDWIVLEVGPGQTLQSFVKLQAMADTLTFSSSRHPKDETSDLAYLLKTLGQLWSNGVTVAWQYFNRYQAQERQRVSLPTYPFEHKRYWIDAPQKSLKAQEQDTNGMAMVREETREQKEEVMSNVENGPSRRQTDIQDKLIEVLARLFSVDPTNLDPQITFFEMGADSLFLLQASQTIRDEMGIAVPFRMLFEECSTIEALATYIDQELPSEEPEDRQTTTLLQEAIATPSVEAGQKPTVPSVLPMQSPLVPLSGSLHTSAIGQTALTHIVEQQLQLMSQQLAILGSAGGALVEMPITPIVENQLQKSEQAPFPQQVKSLSHPATPLQFARPSQSLSQHLDPEIYIPYKQGNKASVKGLTTQQKQHLDTLIERINRKTPASKRRAQDFRAPLADNRASSGFNQTMKEIIYPIVCEHAQGAHIWDIDGNEYVDITMGFGALLFGHSPSFLIEAMQEQLKHGFQLGLQSNVAGEVAQLLTQMTNTERATFVNSGTEAVMTAVRLARAVTGRNKIALFAGSFHGTFDGLLVRAQTDAHGVSRTVPLAPGITPNMVEDVIILEFGAPESYAVLAEHAHELAAVLMEMPQSRRPDVVPIGFIRQVRELADTEKFALIFDEVVTGFRSHPGGAQAVIGVQPDLVTYGKAAAAGLPIGVIAGKAKYMDAIDGGVWQFGDHSYPQTTQTFFAGTYFKHPLIMPGVHAVLKHLQESGPQLQERLTQRTEAFIAEMNAFFEHVNISVALINFGSLCRFVFPAEYKRIDAAVFFYHLLDKGVYFPEGRSCFLSTAHSEEDVAYIIAAMKQSVYEMMAAGFFSASTPPLPDPSDENKNSKRTATSAFPQLVSLPTSEHEEGWQNTATAPLTEEQKELWTLAQMGENVSRAYNEMLALQLSGPLQKDTLYQALQTVISRHEALRTTFSPEGDLQRIAASMKLRVQDVDLSMVPPLLYEQQLQEWMQVEIQHPFDLANGPLIRFHLLKKAVQDVVLILTIHHSIADGWSMGLLLREISALYSAAVKGEICTLPKVMQYREYAQWQGEQQQGLAMKKAEAYWEQQYPTSLPTLNLPTDHPRPSVKAYRGARTRFLFEQQLSKNVREMSGKLNSSLFALLLSTFEVWLQRISGQEQIVVGVPMAGQLAIDDGNFVGHAVNLALMQATFSQDQTFKEHLANTKKALLNASKHQIYPFRQLVKRLNPLRDASRLSVISVAFNVDHDGQTNFADLQTTLLSTPLSAAKYDLFINCTETAHGLQIDCDYDPELFELNTIQLWLQNWATLVSDMLTEPDMLLSQAAVWTPDQWQTLQKRWNQTTTSYPSTTCIHQLFEEQVMLNPEAPALLFDEDVLSYSELNQRANKLAHYLQKAEVGREVCVGLCLERSFEMLIATLAILKAGGIYVPLDPTYPRDRLDFMMSDTQMPVILTQEHLQDRFSDYPGMVLCVDTLSSSLLFESAENLEAGVEATNLAYIMYTSGSTGRPKGVAVTHQNVVRLVKETSYAHFGTDEVLLQFAPISFDAATFEIWGALLNGAQLAMYPPGIPALDELGAFLERSQVTTLWLTSGLFHQMIEQQLSSLRSVRQLLAGGDILSLTQVRKALQELPDCTLINGYGPTENTTFTTCYRMHQGTVLTGSVPIGSPIANTQVYLLDQWLQPVPIGVYGELFIAGDGLARGYFNRPELTAEKFIPHPLSSIGGERLYRTGDLARYLPTGEIEFLGRKDNQVKIRGFRIELGEIEVALSKQKAVQEGIVFIREDVPGTKHLAAYIVPAPDTTISISQIRNDLKELLPGYMLPHSFTFLEQFPLNANGKVDRQALPAPRGNENDLDEMLTDVLDPVERKLAEIWSQLLGVTHVGRDENFFELGGDSIIAIRILARAKEEGIHLSSKQMFQYQTIAELAAVATIAVTIKNDPPQLQSSLVPLTPIQHWFLEQEQPDPHHFNMSIMLEAPADLRLDLLQDAMQHLVMRHDALRIRLQQDVNHTTHFTLAEQEHVTITSVDLSSLTETEQNRRILEQAEDLQKHLNLNQGPLVQAAFFSRGMHKSARVLLIVHHIGIDIVSWQLLLDELKTSYEQLAQGKAIALPQTSTSFAEWSLRLTRHAQSDALRTELSYWTAAERASVVALPVDHAEGVNSEERAAHAHIKLSLEDTQALQLLVQRSYQTQFSDALMAALVAALTRWIGSTSVIVDREGHGRENVFDDVDLSRTVGWFTSIVPIFATVDHTQRMPEILSSMKKQLKQIPHGGIGYGLLRYLSQDQRTVNQLQSLPQAQVSFNYIGRSAQSLPMGNFFSVTGEDRGHERNPGGTRHYLLDINAMLIAGQLRIDCMYSQDIHQAATIETFLQGIASALQELLHPAPAVEKTIPLASENSLSAIKPKDFSQLFSNVKFG